MRWNIGSENSGSNSQVLAVYCRPVMGARLAFPIAFLIFLAADLSFSQAPALPAPQQRVVTLIRRLIALPHLEPDAVAAALGRRLKATQQYEDIRQDYDLLDDQDPVLGKAELRWNRKRPGGFFYVELKPAAWLTTEQVRTVFADLELKGVMSGTDIHAPRELWSTLVVFRSARMDVRFNFPHRAPDVCNHVSIDELSR